MFSQWMSLNEGKASHFSRKKNNFKEVRLVTDMRLAIERGQRIRKGQFNTDTFLNGKYGFLCLVEHGRKKSFFF